MFLPIIDRDHIASCLNAQTLPRKQMALSASQEKQGRTNKLQI